jgi:hypothetical protein
VNEMDLTTFKKEKCELMSRKAEIDDRKVGSKKTTVTREQHKVMSVNADN